MRHPERTRQLKVKKLIIALLVMCLLVPVSCAAPPKPAPNKLPMQLIPKQVEGLRLRETIDIVGVWVIGAELGARGWYDDESGTEFTIEIYRFSSQKDADKHVTGFKNDISLAEKRHGEVLGEDQVIVFSSGVFLFAVWGRSADPVQEIARATGFFHRP